MKKIIAAAAGLMLTGAMISTATAAIEFSGDARARYYYQSDYDFGMTAGDDYDEDHWASRVRLKVKGTTAGGAWAYLQVNADGTWGSDDADDQTSGNDTMEVDYAYVGVPLGCVTLTAGRMNLALTTGFHADTDYDAARLDWANDKTTVAGFYSIIESDYLDGDQQEDRLLGATVIQQINADWSLQVAATYLQLDLSETADYVTPGDGAEQSGLAAVIATTGVLGPVALHAEIGYQEDGVGGSDSMLQTEMTGDDGFGGFVTAGMDFDAVNVTFVGGYVADGYVLDVPVGFIMLAGDSIISVGDTASLGAVDGFAVDTYFAGFKTKYQASEALSLGFNLAYANMEGSDGGEVDAVFDGESTDAYEVSASADYAVSDGAVIRTQLGYFDIDEAEDAALGFAMSLELSF